jgi:hypothetical protein
MNFEYFIFLAFTGLLSTGYKVAKSVNKLDARAIIAETILSLIISLAIVPAIMEEYKITITKAVAMVAIMTIFSNLIIKLVEKKITKKTQEL